MWSFAGIQFKFIKGELLAFVALLLQMMQGADQCLIHSENYRPTSLTINAREKGICRFASNYPTEIYRISHRHLCDQSVLIFSLYNRLPVTWKRVKTWTFRLSRNAGDISPLYTTVKLSCVKYSSNYWRFNCVSEHKRNNNIYSCMVKPCNTVFPST